MDSAQLELAAVQAAAIPRLHSLLVARRGGLVLERYFAGVDQETPNDVRSITKSVVSTLVGTAHQRGLLPNLDTTIAAYLGADYRLDASDSAVTVRDLLTMSSGYGWGETSAEYNRWVSNPAITCSPCWTSRPPRPRGRPSCTTRGRSTC
jgi:CubicO group peptidase (beta-lactamase class C family)